MGFSKPSVKKLTQKKDIEELIKALKYKDEFVRWEAAGALGEIGDKRAVEPLIQALKDKDEHVRDEAASALGEIGDARAVEPLIEALKDIGVEAAEALGEIKDARAVEPLIQALEDIGVEAAEALINIGDERAVNPLIQYLKGIDEGYRSRVQHLFEDMDKIPNRFDAVYRASITEEIHYEGRDVEGLIAKLCTVAIPRTPIITESLVTSEYKHLRESWAGITLKRGTLEELSDAIRLRLQRDSKSRGFDGFQLITYYDQKCSQVESFYVSTFRGYRVWRTKKALFASFWME